MAKQSILVSCKICGKKVHARGLYGHMKLKDHLVKKRVTQVVLPVSNPSRFLSNAEINEPETVGIISSEGALLPKMAIRVNLAGLEEDQKSFTPTFLDYRNSFLKDIERAKREWEKLQDLQKRYSWIIFFDRYKALKRMFGIKEHTS